MIKEDTEKCCRTCGFNAGYVCMGIGKRVDNGESVYGMPIKEAMEMFPITKKCKALNNLVDSAPFIWHVFSYVFAVVVMLSG